jgi:hypothetical protein
MMAGRTGSGAKSDDPHYVSTCFMPISILLAACFSRADVQVQTPTITSSLA